MRNRETFTLAELTEDFFNTLCYVERMRSSELGGPGCILMITETGQEYLLGIEGYDELKPEETVPLFATGDERDEKEFRKIYHAESNGWTYASDFAADILIRDDLYEKMNRLYYDREHRDLKHGDCYMLARRVLNQKEQGERKVYVKTQERWDREEEERRKAEEKRKRLALTPQDVEWKPLHANNLLCNPIEGTYMFLFKKQENGEVAGYKWTIVFQHEEFTHGGQKSDAPIEAYNLYFKDYRNVVGVSGYREPDYMGMQCYQKSTIRDGVHSYGKFVRSYKTLELAKEAALCRNDWIGWGNVNRENIIRVSLDEKAIAEMEKEYEEKAEENSRMQIGTDITFKEIRNYLSRIDRLSICMKETLSYENYLCMRDVPHTYDDYYVYGIGMIDSEFYQPDRRKPEYFANGLFKDLALVSCIEVMLSREPKSVLIERDREEGKKEENEDEM
ncbi:MAG: hypothetical protein NC548_64640 [Lachnospiraceae bacterium]|nr:hypothetical protein [Lachnospiraceae bacterium]